jgi:hypothetical protein
MSNTDPSRPDDIRALGWTVAVHNDYRLNGEPHTFWLFTKPNPTFTPGNPFGGYDCCVKGEGKTDAEALNAVRERLDIQVLT